MLDKRGFVSFQFSGRSKTLYWSCDYRT